MPVVDQAALDAFVAAYQPTTPTNASRRTTSAPPPYTVRDADDVRKRVEDALPQRLLNFWRVGALLDYPSRSEAVMAVLVALSASGEFSGEEAYAAVHSHPLTFDRYLEARHNNLTRANTMLWGDVQKAFMFEAENPRRLSKQGDFDDLGVRVPKASGTTAGHLKANVPKHKPARKLVHVRELAQQTQIDWLIKGYVEHETLCILFGEPSSGKSFVALDIAVAVARGTDWNNQRVAQGGVVYVAGEGHKGIGRRLQAAAREHAFVLGDLPMHVSRTAIAMLDVQAVTLLIEEIQILGLLEDFDPRLVIIDTLRRNFGAGDENSTKDMGAFISACSALQRVLGCTVMVVHHSGHGDKDRERGSSVLIGDFDARYQITTTRNGGLFKCLKLKDAQPPNPLGFTLINTPLGYQDEDGDEITSAVPLWRVLDDEQVKVATVIPRLPLKRSASIGLVVLSNLMSEAELPPKDAAELGAVRVIRFGRWRDACIERQITRSDEREAFKSALRYARTELTAQGLAMFTDDGEFLWITPEGEARLAEYDDLL